MVAAHEDASWRFSWVVAAQAAGLSCENHCKSRDPINQTRDRINQFLPPPAEVNGANKNKRKSIGGFVFERMK
jgi:hypothetical protein